MDRNKKMILYGSFLLVGIAVFVFSVFVFQKPDGIWGLIICITSILTVLGSLVKLCRLEPKFKDGLLKFLDLLWWLP